MNIIIPGCRHSWLVPEKPLVNFNKADHDPRQLFVYSIIDWLPLLLCTYGILEDKTSILGDEELCHRIRDFPDCKNIFSSSMNPFCNLAIMVT